MADPIAPVTAPIAKATGLSKQVVTVAVVAVVGYFVWMWWQKRRAQATSPTATSVPSQAPGAPNANEPTSGATDKARKGAVIA